MSWARLDDKFHGNPKVMAAGLPALGLYALGLSYSADQLTDGQVPRKLVTGWPGWSAAARQLVEVGLWETTEGGWQVHDYCDWNPSRDQVLRDRRSGSKRKQKARDNGVTPAGQIPESGRSHTGRTPGIRPDSGVTLDPRPDPVPDAALQAASFPPNPPPGDSPNEAAPRAVAETCPICRRVFIGSYSEHQCAPVNRPPQHLGSLLPRRKLSKADRAAAEAELAEMERAKAEHGPVSLPPDLAQLDAKLRGGDRLSS